jgi:hypothetical protein
MSVFVVSLHQTKILWILSIQVEIRVHAPHALQILEILSNVILFTII